MCSEESRSAVKRSQARPSWRRRGERSGRSLRRAGRGRWDRAPSSVRSRSAAPECRRRTAAAPAPSASPDPARSPRCRSPCRRAPASARSWPAAAPPPIAARAQTMRASPSVPRRAAPRPVRRGPRLRHAPLFGTNTATALPRCPGPSRPGPARRSNGSFSPHQGPGTPATSTAGRAPCPRGCARAVAAGGDPRSAPAARGRTPATTGPAPVWRRHDRRGWGRRRLGRRADQGRHRRTRPCDLHRDRRTHGRRAALPRVDQREI